MKLAPTEPNEREAKLMFAGCTVCGQRIYSGQRVETIEDAKLQHTIRWCHVDCPPLVWKPRIPKAWDKARKERAK